MSGINGSLLASTMISSYTKEPTGFENRTDSTLSWTDSTPDRTLTITGTHTVFSNGNKIIKGASSVQIPNTVNLYWIYYANDATYTLTAAVSPPTFNSGAILIATVYWNGTAGLLSDERHGLTMDWNTHEFLHRTVGTRYESGLSGTFANTTMDITSGYIWDEDIRLAIGAKTSCIVLYRDSTTWKWTSSSNTVHYITGGNVQYDNAGTMTNASANYYVAYWVFATNNINYPIIAIMGQRQDTTLANARANNTYESLSFGTLPFAEYKVLYRVIVRNDATPYEETQDLRSISNLPSGTYVATDHGVLTGLNNDDHLQYLLREDTNITNGRLCLATGSPDTINQTASATLYFTPYLGNTISLLVGGVNTVKTFTEQSIDFSAKTAAKPYDIFAYFDTTTNTVKIEDLVWTNDTTRATALVFTNGVYYKSGDTSRKYLGTVYTYNDGGTTKIRDEESYRYVDNYYNKIIKNALAYNSTASWTYNTNTCREWNNGTGMTRMQFVFGITKSIVLIMTIPVRAISSPTIAFLGIAINSTTTNSITTLYGLDDYVSISCSVGLKVDAGFHFVTGTENVSVGVAGFDSADKIICSIISC